MTDPIYKVKDDAGNQLDVTQQDFDGKKGASIGIYNDEYGGQRTTFDIEDATDAWKLVQALGEAFPVVAEAISVERRPSKYVVIRPPGTILAAEIYGLTQAKGTNASADAPEYVRRAGGNIGDIRLMCADLNRSGGAE